MLLNVYLIFIYDTLDFLVNTLIFLKVRVSIDILQQRHIIGKQIINSSFSLSNEYHVPSDEMLTYVMQDSLSNLKR
jgi:hypothetical protein